MSRSQLASCPTAPLGTYLRISKFTVRRTATSDTLLGVLFGTAAVLLLCGAFFTRVESISGPGFGLKFREWRDRKDADKALETVASERADEVTPDQVDRAKEIVKQEAVDLREFAVGRRAVAPVPIEPERVEELRRGNPLPPDLLHRLAQEALRKAAAERGDNE